MCFLKTFWFLRLIENDTVLSLDKQLKITSNQNSTFFEWSNTKLVSPWPNFDYDSVSKETTNENLIIVWSDTNILKKEICKGFSQRVDQPNFRLSKCFFKKISSEKKFSNLPAKQMLSETDFDEKELKVVLNNITGSGHIKKVCVLIFTIF